MATIGTFYMQDDGTYTGAIKTLRLNVKTVQLRANDKGDEKLAPDFRVFSGQTEFGAVWKKTSKRSGRDYLSVKLDDPSFPAPIYASLIDAEDGYSLIWSRPQSPDKPADTAD
jgi:uncharacterized protein (DUF736 family)